MGKDYLEKTPSHANLYKSILGKSLKKAGFQYGRGIRDMPRDFMSPEFLTPAYQQVGQNQMGAARNIRSQMGSALGANTSGMEGRALGNLYQNAPYGAANLAARQAGFNRFNQLVQGLAGIKNVESAWRAARKGEDVADESLALQADALEQGYFGMGLGQGGGAGAGGIMGLAGGLGGLFGGGGGGGGGGLF